MYFLLIFQRIFPYDLWNSTRECIKRAQCKYTQRKISRSEELEVSAIDKSKPVIQSLAVNRTI